MVPSVVPNRGAAESVFSAFWFDCLLNRCRVALCRALFDVLIAGPLLALRFRTDLRPDSITKQTTTGLWHPLFADVLIWLLTCVSFFADFEARFEWNNECTVLVHKD